jgi:hypothetical protein
MHEDVKQAELLLRARLASLRRCQQAKHTVGLLRRRPGSVAVVSEETLDQLEAATVVAALRLSRAANSAAMSVLYDGKQPWSPPCLMRAPHRAHLDEALRLLKVAEVALDDDEIRELIRRCVSSPGPGRSTSAGATVASEAETFASAWPYAVTAFNTAAVLYVSGAVKKASVSSDRALTILAASCGDPALLLRCALAATDGSLPVAQQLVSGIISHACITRACVKMDVARSVALRHADASRMHAALTAAELGVKLAKELDETAVARAATLAAMHHQHTEEASALDYEAPGSNAYPDVLHSAWPGMYVGRSAVPLLRAFSLYNAGVVHRDLGNAEASAVLLLSAQRCAQAGGIPVDHALIRLIRSQLASSDESPTTRRCAAQEQLGTRATRPLVANASLHALRAHHGVQQQKRCMCAGAALHYARRGPVAELQRPRRPAAAAAGSSSGFSESWIDDISLATR